VVVAEEVIYQTQLEALAAADHLTPLEQLILVAVADQIMVVRLVIEMVVLALLLFVI
jgi:hypothetical protein